MHYCTPTVNLWKRFTRSFLTALIIALSTFSVHAQTPIWGADAATGVDVGTFDSALSGVGGWTATSVYDNNGSNVPGNALWTLSTTGESQGAYWGTRSAISSPTQANGVAMFDSDYMDNGGVAGAFGTGSSPSPHFGRLVSPVIDLSGYEEEPLAIDLYAYYREFNITELTVGISIDGGTTWTDKDIRNFTPAGDQFEGEIRIPFPTVTQGATNLTNCKIRLQFNGDYYYAMIDDITLRTLPKFDLAMGLPEDGNTLSDNFTTLHVTNNRVLPVDHVDTSWIFYAAEVENRGAIDIQNTTGTAVDVNAKLVVDIQKNTAGSWMTVQSDTGDISDTTILAAGDALVDTFRCSNFSWIEPGEFRAAYRVVMDSTDGSASNDTSFTYFTLTSGSQGYISKVGRDSMGNPEYNRPIIPSGNNFNNVEYGSAYNFAGAVAGITTTIDSVTAGYYIPQNYNGPDTRTATVNVYRISKNDYATYYDLFFAMSFGIYASGSVDITGLQSMPPGSYHNVTVPVEDVNTLQLSPSASADSIYLVMVDFTSGITVTSSTEALWHACVEGPYSYSFNFAYFFPWASPLAIDDGMTSYTDLGFGADVQPSIGVHITTDCVIRESITEEACYSYTSPDGNEQWTATGTYYDTLTTLNGCDSIVEVDLTILEATTAIISPEVCDSYTSPSGNYTWTSPGIYSDTLVNAAGCDSIISIMLSLNYSDSETINPVVCESYTSPSGNHTWTTSGNYADTIPTTTGCDSIININLTVNYNSAGTTTKVVCGSYTSPSGNSTWTSSGIYTDVIQNASGCDSTITINLVVVQGSSASITETACGSYTSPSGNYTWNSTGIYNDTLTNLAGCDSVLTIDLTVLQPSSATLNETVCDSYTSPAGNVYTSSGTYTETLTNAAGCDSTLTINLTVSESSQGVIYEVACDSYISPAGNVYTASGVYQETLTNGVGCDSTLVIYLAVGQNSANTITEVVCGSYTSPLGNNYTASGTYTETLTNAAGCDSVLTIDLTVNQPSTGSVTTSVCDSYTGPSGTVYTTTGVYTETLTNAAGCDSVLTIDLTVGQSSATSISPVVCGTYISPVGSVYTSSGIYTETLTNATGCDSVITIDLTVGAADTTTVSETVCGSNYISGAGNVYSSSGIYTELFTDATGCDSLVTIDLTLLQPTSEAIFETVCDSYTSPAGNVYTTTGTYTETLTNAAGCDSVITIDLTVSDIDKTVDNSNEGMAIANAVGATYQWMDCDAGNLDIPGATNRIYNAPDGGTFAVRVEKNGCMEESICYNVQPLSVGVDELPWQQNIQLYPNPTTGAITINATGIETPARVSITDLSGREVYRTSLQQEGPLNIALDVSAGMYLVNIYDADNAPKAVFKLIKE